VSFARSSQIAVLTLSSVNSICFTISISNRVLRSKPAYNNA